MAKIDFQPIKIDFRPSEPKALDFQSEEPPAPFIGAVVDTVPDPADVGPFPARLPKAPRSRIEAPTIFGPADVFRSEDPQITEGPGMQFTQGIAKGIAEQSQIPALAGKPIPPPKTTAEAVGRTVGVMTESVIELVSLGSILKIGGPIVKGVAAKAAATSLLFGAHESTVQGRKFIAEHVHDGDYGFEGGEAVRNAMVLGAIVSIAFSGAKGIWARLKPTEQSRALKTLGLKKGATLDQINKAARKEALKFHPDKASGMRSRFEKVINARDTLRNAKVGPDIITRKPKTKLLPGEVFGPETPATAPPTARAPLITPQITQPATTPVKPPVVAPKPVAAPRAVQEPVEAPTLQDQQVENQLAIHTGPQQAVFEDKHGNKLVAGWVEGSPGLDRVILTPKGDIEPIGAGPVDLKRWTEVRRPKAAPEPVKPTPAEFDAQKITAKRSGDDYIIKQNGHIIGTTLAISSSGAPIGKAKAIKGFIDSAQAKEKADIERLARVKAAPAKKAIEEPVETIPVKLRTDAFNRTLGLIDKGGATAAEITTQIEASQNRLDAEQKTFLRERAALPQPPKAAKADIPDAIEIRAQKLANKTDSRVGVFLGKDKKWHTFTTLNPPKGVTEYIAITPEIPTDFAPPTPSIGAARRGFESFDPAVKRAMRAAKQLKKDMFIVQSPTTGKFSVRQSKPAKGNFTIVRPDQTFDLIKQASLKAEDAFDFGEKPMEPTKFQSITERLKNKAQAKAADAKSLREEVRALSKVAPITAEQKDVIITRLAKIGPERQAKTNIKDLQRVITDMGRFSRANDKKAAIKGLSKTVKTVQIKTKRGRQQFAKLRDAARERILDALEGIDLKQLTATKRAKLDKIDQMLTALGFTEAEKPEGAAAIEGTKAAKELERRQRQFVGELSTTEIRQIEDAVRLAFLQDQLETNLMSEAEAKAADARKVKAIAETSNTASVKRQAAKEAKGKPIKLRRRIAGLLTWAGRIPTKDSSHIYALARTASNFGSKTLENLVDVERHRGKVRGLGKFFESRDALQEQFKEIGWTNADRRNRIKFHDVVIGGKKFKMTTQDIMSLGMNLRDSENLVELKRTKGLNVQGRRLPRPTIAEIVDAEKNLSDKELAMMDWVQEMNAQHLQPAINETSEEMMGFPLATRPDYWPIVRDVPKRVRGKVADAPAVEDLGPFQPRTGGTQVMVIRSFWDVMLQMQQMATSFHGNAIPLRNVRSLLNDEQWQRNMKDAGREREMQNLMTMFRRLQGVSFDRSSAEQIASFLLNRGARSILGGRLSTVLAQTGSWPMLFDSIPIKYSKPILGFSPQGGKAQSDRMNKFSPFVRMRHVGGRTNLVTGAAGTLSAVDMLIFGHTPILDKPLTPMRVADRLVIEKADTYTQRWVADTTDLKPGSDEFYEEVARRTEDAVRFTQPMWDMDERSVLSSSPNIFLKASLMFRSAREQMLNTVLVSSDAIIKNPSPKTTAKMAQTTTAVGASTVQVRMMKTALRLGLLAGVTAILASLGVRRHRKRILALQTLKDTGQDIGWDVLGHLPFGDEFAFAGRRIIRRLQGKPVWGNRTGNETILAGTPALFITGMESLINAHGNFEKGNTAKAQEQLVRGLNDLIDGAARGIGLPWGGPVGQLVLQPFLKALSQPTDKEIASKVFALTSAKLTASQRKAKVAELKSFGITTKEQIRELLAARRKRDLIKSLHPKPPQLDSGIRAVLGENRALEGFK